MSEKLNPFKTVAYKNAIDVAFIEVPNILKRFYELFSLEMVDEYLLTKCLYDVMLYLDKLTNEEIIMSFKVKCDKENNTPESIAEQNLIINYNIQYNYTSEIAIKATVSTSILIESSFELII